MMLMIMTNGLNLHKQEPKRLCTLKQVLCLLPNQHHKLPLETLSWLAGDPAAINCPAFPRSDG